MRVENHTHWKTSHISAFITRALDLEEIPTERRRRLIVEVVYQKRYCYAGKAIVGGAWMKLCLPRETRVSTEDIKIHFAHTCVHEAAHLRGLQHRAMRHRPEYWWIDGWKEKAAWGSALPLEAKPEEAKPTLDDRRAARREHYEQMVKVWTMRSRRAQTKLAAWKRRLQGLERLPMAVQKQEVAKP